MRKIAIMLIFCAAVCVSCASRAENAEAVNAKDFHIDGNGTITAGDSGWRMASDVPHNDSDYITSDGNGTVTGYTGSKGTSVV
ncbi:MAG: hypothetical protein LBI06_07860, partial [Treponema sp.]|nr:hypothetical protein [Treponema sp.]